MTYSVTPQTWVTTSDFPDFDSLTDSEKPLVEGWIESYAGEVEAKAVRKLSVLVNEERCEVLGDMVVTRYRPVTCVDEIVFGGATGITTDVSSGNIIMTGFQPSLLSGDSRALVSYAASFSDEVLAGARGIVIERARRRLAREQDDAIGTDNVSEEGYSAQLIADSWLESELAFIESIRRRVGA